MSEPTTIRLIPLAKHLKEELYRLSAKGRNASKEGTFEEAEKHFLAAWDLIPEPKTMNDSGGSFSSGMVTFYRDEGMHCKAKEWFLPTFEAYGKSNPYSLFLAGTVAYHGTWDNSGHPGY